MAERNERFQTATARTPTAQRRHVGLDPGLVDKHQTPWVNPVLPGFPAEPAAGDISVRLLAGEYGFYGMARPSFRRCRLAGGLTGGMDHDESSRARH
jgi:hypothetical protein